MDNLNYSEIIDQLVAGSIKEILVRHDDFSEFHQVWIKHPKRDEIVGRALKGGDILYHYESEL